MHGKPLTLHDFKNMYILQISIEYKNMVIILRVPKNVWYKNVPTLSHAI